VHLTAEYWPYARTGGLAEAVQGLASYQARAGHVTTVVLPCYRSVRESVVVEPDGEPFAVEVGPRTETVRLLRPPEVRGPRIRFLEHDGYFDRPGVYGERGGDYADNPQRFACLCRAVAELMPGLARGPVVLHAHDWHTALAIVYARTVFAGDSRYDRMACVLSVHNAGFQGHFGRELLADLGLPEHLWSMEFMEWYGRLNLLKGGLAFSDFVTTVSPTHAHELRTEVGGFGLHDSFIALRHRLAGILNGIDQELWTPAADRHLPARFSPDDLAGKDECKRSLQDEWGVTGDVEAPIFGMSARLVAQKGLDLVLASEALRQAPAQFLFLGAGEPRYEEALRGVAATYPGRVGANFAFSDAAEHRLLGGADFLLMPSLYEPCGLTQMRAQRYGALPVARRVGGLADTIEDEISGFLFDDYTPAAFDVAVRRALALFADRPARVEFARRAMLRDFGWERAVERYQEVYQRALAARC
jgi:starch synthase